MHKENIEGYNNIIHCGNLTEGLYPVTSKYDETTFLKDTLKQVDYIVKNYMVPKCVYLGSCPETHSCKADKNG